MTAEQQVWFNRRYDRDTRIRQARKEYRANQKIMLEREAWAIFSHKAALVSIELKKIAETR